MNEQELKEKIFRMDGKINELTISNDTLQTVMKVKDELIKRLKDEGKQCCETCKHLPLDKDNRVTNCSKGNWAGLMINIEKIKCNLWEAR